MCNDLSTRNNIFIFMCWFWFGFGFWWFCFVFIVCMVVWSNLVFHSEDRKPEGKTISLSSLTNKSLNFNWYDLVYVHTARYNLKAFCSVQVYDATSNLWVLSSYGNQERFLIASKGTNTIFKFYLSYGMFKRGKSIRSRTECLYRGGILILTYLNPLLAECLWYTQCGLMSNLFSSFAILSICQVLAITVLNFLFIFKSWLRSDTSIQTEICLNSHCNILMSFISSAALSDRCL